MLGKWRWNCKALLGLAALILVSSADADVLHLQDGTRYNGTLISETPAEIVFEIVLGDGRSTYRKTFARTNVKAIERRALEPALAKPTERQDPSTFDARDADQILRESFELLDANDIPAALGALQRLVLRTAPDELAALSDKCRRERGVALDELLARARLRDALSQRSGRLVALETATRYESPVLSRLAADKIDALLSTSHAGKTVQDWAAQPDGYSQFSPDALALVREARIAAGLIAARLKLDDQFKQDSPERRRLRGLQDQLTRLVTRVTSMHGYTGLGAGAEEDDPTISEARQLATRPAATQPASQPENPDDASATGAKP